MLEWLEARCSDPRPVFSKCFEKLVRDYICSVLPASLDPLQFAYRSNRSTEDAIAFTLHTALSHLENKNTYVRMLFVDYSSPFNTIVPATLVAKLQALGLKQISVQLDPGLPDRQKSGGQNGQQHLISPGPQHWCSAGLAYTHWLHTAPMSSSNLADDTTVIGLITDNDETAYREEVSTLTKWCQENHLSLNIDKTKQLVVDFRRQSRVHTPTQMQCWRRHISASSSWDGRGSLEWAPASSDPSTPALWRASWPLHHRLVWKQAPLATAKLLQRVVRTARHIVGGELPSLQDIYTRRCTRKARRIIKDSSHRPKDCSLCCPQGDVSAASDPALADWGTAFSLSEIRQTWGGRMS